MKKVFSITLALLMILSCFSFVGCGNKEQDTVLRICNCEDYIDETLLEDFEKEYPYITVEYSTYGTNENLYNELVINPESYDLVVPSEYMIEKLAAEGRIQKLDFNKLSSYQKNLSPFIKERLNGMIMSNGNSIYDYMVGYMWGTMGWVYNTDYVDLEEVKSWEGVFSNKDLQKKITIKDAVRDSYLVGLAMVYKDQISGASNQEITNYLNRTDKEAISKVEQKLNSLKPMLYGFEVDSGKNDIILGNIYAYVAWSGDAAYAIDVASGDAEDEDGTTLEESKRRSLSYSIPEEGSNIWFDGFVMPSASTNQDAAYKFLEFITRPESVYRNMDYTGYTGMVSGGEFELDVYDEDDVYQETITTNLFEQVVLNWFDESEDPDLVDGIEVDLSYFFGNDKEYVVTVSPESYGRLIAQYPEENIVERCAVMSYFKDDALMDINDMWEKVKGETFDTWLILLVVGLVVLLAVLILLIRHKDKIFRINIPVKEKNRLEKSGYRIIKIEEIK